MSVDRIKIGIKENGIIYQVTSIYLLKDGSFKVDVPYCKYTGGMVMKAGAKYFTGAGKARMVQEFLVTNRPQLSIHASGFVQFSGKNIISGIDKMTGKNKRYGIDVLTSQYTNFNRSNFWNRGMGTQKWF